MAAVGVDEWSRHFAGGGHAAPRGAYAFLLHVRIAGDGQFAQDGPVVYGRGHFQKGALGIAAVDVVAADDYVFETFGAPLVGGVAGEFVVAWGAGDGGVGGGEVWLAAAFIGGGGRRESGLELWPGRRQ